MCRGVSHAGCISQHTQRLGWPALPPSFQRASTQHIHNSSGSAFEGLSANGRALGDLRGRRAAALRAAQAIDQAISIAALSHLRVWTPPALQRAMMRSSLHASRSWTPVPCGWGLRGLAGSRDSAGTPPAHRRDIVKQASEQCGPSVDWAKQVRRGVAHTCCHVQQADGRQTACLPPPSCRLRW
jgi:hypothetical protein